MQKIKSTLIKHFLISTLAILIVQMAWAVEALEHEIKATYLYNFAKFIDWPEGKLEKDPIYLCIMGKESLKSSLERLAMGKSIKNRPLHVRQLDSIDEIKSCHILFIGAAASKNLPEILRKLRFEKVLCVGDTPDFIEQGGQIQFFVNENKVGFEVNLPAVKQAGLKIDARVLNIAKVRR
ncbi:MAG: YfiR family protein [Bacteriovorax sp.]|nr:YfiR family protein [Bacteriovorax sp.]